MTTPYRMAYGRPPEEPLDTSEEEVLNAIYWSVHDIYDPSGCAPEELMSEWREAWMALARQAKALAAMEDAI